LIKKEEINQNNYVVLKSDYYSYYKNFKENITVSELDNFIFNMGYNICDE
jgi:hypothetical protein